MLKKWLVVGAELVVQVLKDARDVHAANFLLEEKWPAENRLMPRSKYVRYVRRLNLVV